MIARFRRTLTLGTIACLVIALATFGGYRLAGSLGSAPGHVRLADGLFDTWVSNNGSDINATNGNFCDHPTPCKTFGGALGATSPGGEIDTLDPLYSFGTVTITKAVTIDGLGGDKAIVFGGSTVGIIVRAGPNDVVILRHLQIRGYGGLGTDGIQFLSGKALILDDVVVEGLSQHGVDVELSAPGSLTIMNSRIYNNGLAGVAIADSGGTVQTTISHSQLTNNYYGVIAEDGADVDLTDSVVARNTSIGVGCQTFGNGPCTIQTENGRLDHNWAAIWMNHGAGNAQITETLFNDAVFGNSYGIYGDFGGTLNAASFGNNRFVNNFIDGAASSSMSVK